MAAVDSEVQPLIAMSPVFSSSLTVLLELSMVIFPIPRSRQPRSSSRSLTISPSLPEVEVVMLPPQPPLHLITHRHPPHHHHPMTTHPLPQPTPHPHLIAERLRATHKPQSSSPVHKTRTAKRAAVRSTPASVRDPALHRLATEVAALEAQPPTAMSRLFSISKYVLLGPPTAISPTLPFSLLLDLCPNSITFLSLGRLMLPTWTGYMYF